MLRLFSTQADLLVRTISASLGPYGSPSVNLILAGLFPALLIGLFSLRLDGFWEIAGPFGVTAVALLSWFAIGVGIAEYQRAAYFSAKRRHLWQLDMETLDGESKNARRGLIASARAYVEHMSAEQSARLDFRSALESTRIFYALRSHLSQKFLDELARSGRAMLIAPIGSRLPGVAHAFLDELDRLEREWELA